MSAPTPSSSSSHQAPRPLVRPTWRRPAPCGPIPPPCSSPVALAASPQQQPQQQASQWGRGSSSPTTAAGSRRSITSSTQEAEKSRRGSSKGPGRPEGSGGEEGWGFWDVKRLAYRWTVPWGGASVVGGMALWFGSFAAVGFLLVPALYQAAGKDLSTLTMPEKAQFTLVTQAVVTLVGLSIIRVVTVGPMDEAGEPASPADRLFNYSPAEPFRKPYGWAAWALLGVALSPFVVGTVATVVSLVGYDESVGGRGTVDGVAGMIQVDLPTYLALLLVTGVLAPLLEETVFRGFLLTSLTRWMPTWAALGVSSLAFGLCHLSPRDLPVLTTLGMMLGAFYVRSRNLLTPMIIHGAWNSAVLTLLFALAQAGVNLEEALALR